MAGWVAKPGKGAEAAVWHRDGRPSLLPVPVHSLAGRTNGVAGGFTPSAGVYGYIRPWRDSSGLVFAGPASPVVWDDVGGDAEPPECVVEDDYDADGLTRARELELGIEPCKSDTDGDGLPDGFEVLGVDVDGGAAAPAADGSPDLDLPRWGSNPKRRDVFVEVEWMRDGASWCVLDRCSERHSHRPWPEMFKRVIDAFAAAPTVNYDGSRGIALHIDAGTDMTTDSDHWRRDGHGGPIDHAESLFASYSDTADDAAAARIVREYGDPRPDGGAVFHYALFAHRIAPGTDGIAGRSFGIPGDTFVVSYGSGHPTETALARTFMHELGHNLNLRHGGNHDTHYKPNYLSVMNYTTAGVGLRVHGRDGLLDYSRFQTAPLHRDNLDERVGVTLADGVTQSPELPGNAFADYGVRVACDPRASRVLTFDTPAPVDFNCDGDRDDTGVSRVLTDESASSPFGLLPGGSNDWDNLSFEGGGIGGADDTSPMHEPEQPEPDIPTTLAVSISGPDRVQVPRGTTVRLRWTVRGDGTERAMVIVQLPGYTERFTLDPGQERELSAIVGPVTAPTAPTATARPDGNPLMGAQMTTEIEPVDVAAADPADLLSAVGALLAGLRGAYPAQARAISYARDHICRARRQLPGRVPGALLDVADALGHLVSAGPQVPTELPGLLARLSEGQAQQLVGTTSGLQQILGGVWMRSARSNLAAGRTTQAAYDFATAARLSTGGLPSVTPHLVRDLGDPPAC